MPLIVLILLRDVAAAIFSKKDIIIVEPFHPQKQLDYTVLKEKNGEISIRQLFIINKIKYVGAIDQNSNIIRRFSEKNDSVIGVIIQTIHKKG